MRYDKTNVGLFNPEIHGIWQPPWDAMGRKLSTRGALRSTLLRAAVVLEAVNTVEAAVEDFACARDGSFIEVIQYLEQAAG
jgi:hypothetical protein